MGNIIMAHGLNNDLDEDGSFITNDDEYPIPQGMLDTIIDNILTLLY